MKKPFIILSKAMQEDYDLNAPGWREMLGADIYDAPTLEEGDKDDL